MANHRFNPISTTSSSPQVRIRSSNFCSPMSSFRICGPKLSLCGVIVSAWGVIQLTIMGLAFTSRSVALVEDINFNETVTDPKERFENMDLAYEVSANNCYIAAALYLVTLVVSLHQRWANSQDNPSGYVRYG